MGKAIVEALRETGMSDMQVIAVGTNSTATAAMLQARADGGATGENALIVNCRNADYIIGPVGILVADALHGEVSAAMAVAVGQSPAVRILLPVSRCNTHIVGVRDEALGRMVHMAVEALRANWEAR